MKSILKTGLLLAATLLSQSALAKINVFACEPEWAALAHELGGEAVKVTTATHGLQDPHRIQARPSLIARIRRADLLVCTGAELEIGWLPVLLRKSGNAAIQPGEPGHFLAADTVELLDAPDTLDRSEGDIHAEGNPHIQTDPRRIAEVAEALSKRLEQIDPAHAGDYADRYRDFSKRWRAAIARWEKQAAPIRGKAIVVQHKNWTYLEDWLGLKEIATLEPKPGVPPTASHLARVLDAVKGRDALAIIRAAYQSPKASNWLSQRSGMPAVELPFTVGGAPEVKTLFDLFDLTLARLTGAEQ